MGGGYSARFPRYDKGPKKTIAKVNLMRKKSMIIDDIEYHIGILGSEEEALRALPTMMAVYVWADKNGFLSNDGIAALGHPAQHSISIDYCEEIIYDKCDGKILSEYFNPIVRDFISSYIETGEYWIDVESKFGVESIYDVELGGDVMGILVGVIENSHRSTPPLPRSNR